ncbi:MAG: DNA topoisomerase, partial [Bacteroidota bacterium]
YGAKYLPEKEVIYKTKDKQAQEAHEAIRPTDPARTPESLKTHLSGAQLKIYTLIWQRMVACQMAPAIFDATAVHVIAKDYLFSANGQVMKFDGFAKVYPIKSKEVNLPPLTVGEELNVNSLNPVQHFTEPPARYTEATLIKALEEFGIGRPSTYAPTISTIQDRNYVIKDLDKKLVPTEIGTIVNKLLVQHFANIVDLKFTADMEKHLDKVADAQAEWRPLIRDFYGPFKENLLKKEKEINKKELTETATKEVCNKCGSPMVEKLGRFGKFIACSNYPECKNTKPVEAHDPAHPHASEHHGGAAADETKEVCDKCQSPMIIKHGRFGKFLACSKYPDCKNVKSIIVSTGVKCPACEKGEIAERKSKRGRIFYSCTKYPDCKFALWNKPTGDKCPKCSSLLVSFGKENKIKCSSKECDHIAPEKPATEEPASN